MLLSRFIENTLKQLDKLESGVVEFDLGVAVHHADFGDNAGKIIVNDNSKNRIRFSVKIPAKDSKEAKT